MSYIIQISLGFNGEGSKSFADAKANTGYLCSMGCIMEYSPSDCVSDTLIFWNNLFCNKDTIYFIYSPPLSH
jgi:hypothetical protein